MKRSLLIALIAALWAPLAVGAEPAKWDEFLCSPVLADKKLVAEITKMKWWDACVAWGKETRKPADTRRAKALALYLVKERMLSPQDFGHVSDRTLDIGMTACGMFAAKGHTTTAIGTTTQYVYGSRVYVYTEPSRDYSVGVVRAIQH